MPGYADFDQPPPAAALRALRAAFERGARVMSICVGAFALGYAGLLDDCRATPHWVGAPLLAATFPRVEVLADVLYVDEGRILTWAGAAAGLDLALHVVRRDCGAAAAAEIARWNVIAPHRDGGHAQFAPKRITRIPNTGLGATRGGRSSASTGRSACRSLRRTHAATSTRSLGGSRMKPAPAPSDG